jgi:hypothetical protein
VFLHVLRVVPNNDHNPLKAVQRDCFKIEWCMDCLMHLRDHLGSFEESYGNLPDPGLPILAKV